MRYTIDSHLHKGSIGRACMCFLRCRSIGQESQSACARSDRDRVILKFVVGIDQRPYDLESYVVSSDFAPWNCHMLPGLLVKMRKFCNVSSVLQENADTPSPSAYQTYRRGQEVICMKMIF